MSQRVVKFRRANVEERGLWLQEVDRTAFLLPKQMPGSCWHLQPVWDARGWFSVEGTSGVSGSPAPPGRGLLRSLTQNHLHDREGGDGGEGGGDLFSFPRACVSQALQQL